MGREGGKAHGGYVCTGLIIEIYICVVMTQNHV